MGRYRTLSKKNKYYLPKYAYATCYNYARQYRDWKAELDAERDTRGAIRYDKDRVQTSNDYDSTSATAIRMIEIEKKCAIIDECIHIACDGSNLDNYLRLGVCYGFEAFQLITDQRMPCSKSMYYDIRQRFYYELNKKI